MSTIQSSALFFTQSLHVQSRKGACFLSANNRNNPNIITRRRCSVSSVFGAANQEKIHAWRCADVLMLHDRSTNKNIHWVTRHSSKQSSYPMHTHSQQFGIVKLWWCPYAHNVYSNSNQHAMFSRCGIHIYMLVKETCFVSWNLIQDLTHLLVWVNAIQFMNAITSEAHYLFVLSTYVDNDSKIDVLHCHRNSLWLCKMQGWFGLLNSSLIIWQKLCWSYCEISRRIKLACFMH